MLSNVDMSKDDVTFWNAFISHFRDEIRIQEDVGIF
jgi:hypothetical protein